MVALATPSPALATVFRSLVRYHIATAEAPLPEPASGITWIWAANGIFKRGSDTERELLIQVGESDAVPGLARLLPSVRWAGVPGRIPGGLLTPILEHAQRACEPNTVIGRPIEQQYFCTYREGLPRPYRVSVPPQRATPGSIRYDLETQGRILVDLHSHHALPAYFSATDNRDDQGLSVSAVIGRIFTTPTLVCRLNVYGHHQLVPATMIFDRLGPFRDGYGGADADISD